MQPIAANLSVGIPSIGGPDHLLSSEQCTGNQHVEAADTELLPTIATLQQIVDRPDMHTVGDLAALTDQLTSELMLFSALVGLTATPNSIGPETKLGEAPAGADARQNDLHAEFLRDLEG